MARIGSFCINLNEFAFVTLDKNQTCKYICKTSCPVRFRVGGFFLAEVCYASIAQSVERNHGKVEVNSSILFGGCYLVLEKEC